jgi:hypothetical protein
LVFIGRGQRPAGSSTGARTIMDKLRDKARRTFTGSATGAIAALLVIGAVTFGSTVIRPMTSDRHNDATTAKADDTSGWHDGSGGNDATEPITEDGPGFTLDQHGLGDAGQCQDEQGNSIPCDGDQPPSDPPSEPPVEEPKDPPSEPPSEPPAPSDAMTLAAVFNADMGKIVVEWSAFGGDFDKYKLVRSADGDPSWPLGSGDQLVAVVGPDGNRRFADHDVPCNTEFHYRAFAVNHTETGYVVLAASNVGTATRACDEPPAEPGTMAFQAVQSADGVKLSWEACSSDAFAAYKVVRSATNPNPMYPLNDGTELLVYFHDQGTTHFTDSDVEAGQTWTYRVLCMGHNGDGYYALAMTSAMTVTVE